MMDATFLIVDGYSQAGREELGSAGMSPGWALYARMLNRWLPEAEYVCWRPNESATTPDRKGPEHYAAVLWTGSNLNVHEREDQCVARQVEFAAETYAAGTPAFGSCWGLQVAVAAAGGEVLPNPRGREIGIARRIQVTPEGRRHPMFEGKPAVFDNFGSHLDEATRLPEGAVVLAGNGMSRVQAIEIRHGRGSFWGVQYHPEYDFHEIGCLMTARARKLLGEGFFQDEEDLKRYLGKFEALHRAPNRKDLRWQLDAGDDLVSAKIRQLEFRNWIQEVVLPRAGA